VDHVGRVSQGHTLPKLLQVAHLLAFYVIEECLLQILAQAPVKYALIYQKILQVGQQAALA
jgi:hypothetical protein